MVRAGSRPGFSYVVGLEPGASGAGPWQVSGGKRMPGPGEAAVHETHHAGTRYVFCSQRCLQRFEDAPAHYL